jgi:hypothetical protein
MVSVSTSKRSSGPVSTALWSCTDSIRTRTPVILAYAISMFAHATLLLYHTMRPTDIHQLISCLDLSNPPLSCLSGFTTFPCNTVYRIIFSQSSGRTLASHMHCAASLVSSSCFLFPVFSLCPPFLSAASSPSLEGDWTPAAPTRR